MHFPWFFSSAATTTTMQKLMEKIWPFSYQRIPDTGSLELPLMSSNSDAQTLENFSPNLKIFTMRELRKATSNFCSSNKLGYDETYKGWINERTNAATKPGKGLAVVVKRLYAKPRSNEEWLKEIKLLGQLEYPTLVRVLGYCLENNKKPAIVSEYMPQGRLTDYLFKKDLCTKLTWTLRMKIALGAAKGLAFLLNSEPSLLYWNCVTSSNILLDSDYNAKLYDFRCDKNEFSVYHHYTARAYATRGFLGTGRHKKKEVYCFGVVLFEILFGRRAFDLTKPLRKTCLVDWVHAKIRRCKCKTSEEQGYRGYWASEVLRKSGLVRVIDSHYGGNYPFQSAVQLFSIAVACTHDDPNARADMEEVIEALETLQENKD